MSVAPFDLSRGGGGVGIFGGVGSFFLKYFSTAFPSSSSEEKLYDLLLTEGGVHLHLPSAFLALNTSHIFFQSTWNLF